jgi:EmrB/QacA subfamily drug resistance transporter
MNKKTQGSNKIPRDLLITGWILVIGGFAPLLGTTLMNIAVDSIAAAFHVSLTTVSWAVTAYTLALGVAVPFSAWLSNKFDGKTVYLISISVFGAASLLAGLSTNFPMLLAARIIQGAAAGVITPLLTTLLVQYTGGQNLGQLMAVVGLPSILAPLCGPILGGFLVSSLVWRSIFTINVPICLIALALALWKLQPFKPMNPKAKFDALGTALLALMFTAFVFGVSKNPLYLIPAALLLGGYIGYAARVKDLAVVPLSLFRAKTFDGSTIGLLLTGMVTNGPMLLLPLFFQNISGMTVIGAALCLIPQGLSMLIARPFVGKLTDKIGARMVTVWSLILTIAGTLPFLFFSQSTGIPVILAALFVRGLGAGGITIPMMTDAYTELDKPEVPAATTGTRITQNIGGALGSAVLGMLLGVLPGLAGYRWGFGLSCIVSVAVILPSMLLSSKTTSKPAIA